MSGYTGDAIERGGGTPPGVELLRKPFSPRTLLRHVRRALDTIRDPTQCAEWLARGTKALVEQE